MKLPGDSDNMDKGVSHEMMQRSLQSQRRVVKRVGLLEDRVDELESAEVEPGVELGDIADGAKKIATKIGDKAGDVGKSIGKNAQLLGDKATAAAQAAKDADAAFAEVMRILKPGGVFVVLDHAATPGSPPSTGGTIHRIDPGLVLEWASEAGFMLAGESDVLCKEPTTRGRDVTPP